MSTACEVYESVTTEQAISLTQREVHCLGGEVCWTRGRQCTQRGCNYYLTVGGEIFLKYVIMPDNAENLFPSCYTVEVGN